MKIKVEPLFPTGSYLNCRIGIEKDIPDTDNEEQAINQAWDNLIAIHMKRYPNLYTKDGKPKYEMYQGEEPERQIKEPEPKLTKEEKQKKYITDTTTIEGADGLKSFALLVSKNKHLEETYNAHMEFLTNKQ